MANASLRATIILEGNEIIALLSDGRVFRNVDAVELAKLLLAAGLSHEMLDMPDWCEGGHSLTGGQKIAIKWQMHQGGYRNDTSLPHLSKTKGT